MTTASRLVERAEQVLALGEIDAGLAADRGIDLGHEGRRDVDDRDAAQVGRGEEAGRVAERTAADRDERLAALDAEPGQVAGGRLDDRQALGVLALREHDASRPASRRRKAGRERLAGRRPGAGLGDQDGPRRPGASSFVADGGPGDPIAEDEPADRRHRPGGASWPGRCRDPSRRAGASRSSSTADLGHARTLASAAA